MENSPSTRTPRLFAKCDEKLGMVPNVLQAYTRRPGEFRTFSRFYNEWRNRG